jgi:hypothetical protein
MEQKTKERKNNAPKYRCCTKRRWLFLVVSEMQWKDPEITNHEKKFINRHIVLVSKKNLSYSHHLVTTDCSNPRLLLCDGSEITVSQPWWWWHSASAITLWWAPWCSSLCALATRPITDWFRFTVGGITRIWSWYSVEVLLVYYFVIVSKLVVTFIIYAYILGKLLILAPAKFWCKPIKLSLLPQFSVVG